MYGIACLTALTCLYYVYYYPLEGAVPLAKERTTHQAAELIDNDLLAFAKLSDMKQFEEVLDNILIPRVVGTENHEKVKQYLIDMMKDAGWTVESDEFQGTAPIFGKLKFTNIIADLNPSARRHLVLACHYDSKYFKNEYFVGATDSAVPCAMMVNLAYVMKKQLNSIKNNNDVSLRFIFFDGEEAFKKWGPTDSIYGAKHLAAKLEKTPYPVNSRDTSNNHLDRIDVLVLLDLLGSPDPKFYSYFAETENWYLHMMDAELKLARLGQLERYSGGKPEQQYFVPEKRFGGIEDDHIPFLIRGVPILHVIPSPFPRVWHQPSDDKSAVDFYTVENLNKIIRVFLAKYLHIPAP